MIIPTSQNFKFKFPEFANIEDQVIEFMIEESSRWVDDSWLPNDRTLALLYLSAHYLQVSLQRAQSATGQVVSSERMGEMAVTYAPFAQPKANDISDLRTTLYGLRYIEMAHVNFPPIAVV